MNGNAPAVSVVLPVYNRARVVLEALESVFSQTFKDFECIAVDDGSTDGTADVLVGYGGRVRCIRQDNAGPGEARNRGILEAVGRYVAFIDSDDLWRPERLARQMAAAESARHEPVLWFSDSEVLWEDGSSAPSEWEASARFHPDVARGGAGRLERPNELLVTGYIVTTSTVLVKRDALLRVGMFRAGQRESEDLDLFIRLGREGAFGFVNESLAVRRMQKDKTNFKTIRAYRERQRIFASLADDEQLSPRGHRIARRNWCEAVLLAQGILKRSGQKRLARREIRSFPRWWACPGLLLRYLALVALPRHKAG